MPGVGGPAERVVQVGGVSGEGGDRFGEVVVGGGTGSPEPGSQHGEIFTFAEPCQHEKCLFPAGQGSGPAAGAARACHGDPAEHDDAAASVGRPPAHRTRTAASWSGLPPGWNYCWPAETRLRRGPGGSLHLPIEVDAPTVVWTVNSGLTVLPIGSSSTIRFLLRRAAH